MNGLEIALEYKKEVLKLFKDITLILYGSTVYGCSSSDLDVCLIKNQDFSNEEMEELKKVTKNFHLRNGLRIDEEIPYEKKLGYTYSFIDDALINLPFTFKDNHYIIEKIEKTKEFLTSEMMRKRLILNILTTKNIVLAGDETLIKKYHELAWEQILKVVISYSGIDNFFLQDLLKCLYSNPFTKEDGEMYLGYKTNLDAKKVYLQDTVSKQLESLKEQKKLIKTLNNTFITDSKWLKEGWLLNNERN